MHLNISAQQSISDYIFSSPISEFLPCILNNSTMQELEVYLEDAKYNLRSHKEAQETDSQIKEFCFHKNEPHLLDYFKNTIFVLSNIEEEILSGFEFFIEHFKRNQKALICSSLDKKTFPLRLLDRELIRFCHELIFVLRRTNSNIWNTLSHKTNEFRPDGKYELFQIARQICKKKKLLKKFGLAMKFSCLSIFLQKALSNFKLCKKVNICFRARILEDKRYIRYSWLTKIRHSLQTGQRIRVRKCCKVKVYSCLERIFFLMNNQERVDETQKQFARYEMLQNREADLKNLQKEIPFLNLNNIRHGLCEYYKASAYEVLIQNAIMSKNYEKSV